MGSPFLMLTILMEEILCVHLDADRLIEESNNANIKQLKDKIIQSGIFYR